MLWTVY